MVQKDIKITGDSIWDARAAAMLVQECSKFESKIMITDKEKTINAKSIMGVLSLKAKKDDILRISAEGNDEDKVLNALSEFFSKR